MAHRIGSYTWKDRGSSGSTDLERDRIVVTAGASRLDAKLVLLHELAHHVTKAWHTPAFWDVAWKLYRWAKLPILYVKRREGHYRKGALVAYRRNMKGRG